MKVCFPCLFPCRRNPIPIHRNTSGPVPARPARAWTVSRCATRPETFSTASTSRKSVPTSASAFRPQPAVHPGQPIDLPPVSEGNRDTTALGLPPLSARFRGQDGNHGTRGTTRVLELFRQFKKLRRSQPSWGGARRRNETHASTTDPEARRLRKGPGQEARLAFLGHALTETATAC